jgi:pyridoxine kinase
MKRIVTIQDISAVGKCSLTVALPIISAMGVETAVIPTAVLSTHTAFKGFTFHDLTAEIKPICDHWESQGITFDAVYTGYLGSFEQLHLVKDLFDRFGGGDSLILVDPVMADHGKLYAGFTEEFAAEMAKLCGKADVIVPNLTEACFMLGIPYPEGGECPPEMARDIVKKLTSLGCPNAVLTGMSTEEGKLGVLAYSAQTDTYYSYENEHLPVSFHGTGDVFSSALLGGAMQGLGLYTALDIAVDYTLEAIRATMEDPDHRWYGVNFETATKALLDLLEEKQKDPAPKGKIFTL